MNEFIVLPIGKLEISKFNPRKIRPEEDVKDLAKRIKDNGFESSRALWVHEVNSHYEVFAGGTRLEAAKVAGLTEVPVFVYADVSEEEVVRLADQDNENDECHKHVNIVDTWASYKFLSDLGWTQEEIAKAKGVSRQTVGYKTQYASFPQDVLGKFATKNSLNESHARELLNLPQCGKNTTNAYIILSPWRTLESVMLDTIANVCDRVRVKDPTAKQFADEVARQNELTEYAMGVLDKLEGEWRTTFLARLQQAKADDKPSIQSLYNKVANEVNDQRREYEASLRRELEESERLRQEEEEKLRLQEARAAVMAKLVLGDAVAVMQNAPDEIRLMSKDIVVSKIINIGSEDNGK